MAWIREIPLTGGGKAYKVEWRGPDGTRGVQTFSSRTTPRPATEARRFKARIETELLAGTYVDPAAGKITFAAYAQEYLDTRILREASMVSLRSIVGAHLVPLMGSMCIGAVRRRDVQRMVAALVVRPVGGNRTGPRPCLAPGYIEQCYRIFSMIMRAAVLDGIIPESPCVQITLPRRDKTELLIPTPAQVEIVAARMPANREALIHLAAGTGLRSGEARGLDPTRCVLLTRTVKVDRQVHVGESGPHTFGPPKTDNSHRSVPITTECAQRVAAHIAAYGLGIDDLIFTGRGGGPIRRKVLAEQLGPVLRDLGFPRGSGMHLFRHFYASELIAGGLDIRAVAGLLGDTMQEVQKTYAHLLPDHAERARAAVEATFRTGHRGGTEAAGAAEKRRQRGTTVSPLTG